MTSILFSNKRYYYLLLAFCSIAFVILFAYVNSPLYVRRGIDQMIFQQIGYAILEGKVPYIDVFDHKGFYLFLFQAIGLFIGGGDRNKSYASNYFIFKINNVCFNATFI